MRTLALLLLSAGMLLAGDGPKKEAAQVKKLWASMSVSRPVFEKGAGDSFVIYFALVNDSDKTINPDLDSSRLLVNGKELKDWPFIVSQGPRDARWQALPAGDYLSFAYAMGRYFDEPATFKVAWKGKDFEAAEIVFRVMPKKGK
jgi:hypothetical protein